MSSVVNTPSHIREALHGKLYLADSKTHRMEIIAVGNYCPEEDTVYLHLSSLEKFRHQKNGKNPVQYGGWFYAPWAIENVEEAAR